MISAMEEIQSVASCIEIGGGGLPSGSLLTVRVLLRARIGASLEKKRLMDREHQRTKELERTLRLLEQAQDQLSVLASRDALTGLGNRRSIEAQLADEASSETRCSRHCTSI